MLKNAITYYEQLLAHDGLIAGESSSTITEESMLLADLYQHTLPSLVEKKFITEEKLIISHKIDNDNVFKEVEQEDESDYEPEEKSREAWISFQ